MMQISPQRTHDMQRSLQDLCKLIFLRSHKIAHRQGKLYEAQLAVGIVKGKGAGSCALLEVIAKLKPGIENGHSATPTKWLDSFN